MLLVARAVAGFKFSHLHTLQVLAQRIAGKESSSRRSIIVLACQATLATRNTSHFEDLSVPVINPWAGE